MKSVRYTFIPLLAAAFLLVNSHAWAQEPATEASQTTSPVSYEDIARAPEATTVNGILVHSDGTTASQGIVYFIYQNRLNEIPHNNPLAHAKSMTEAATALDGEGSFTLKMQPGNFAMIYDPAETVAPTEPGPNSMAVSRRQAREQVQARIAAIKENAMRGLPIDNGMLESAYVIENRFVRPPASSFGIIQLQNDAIVTIKAVSDEGELINFPATLRIRGKNGDILEPHTPGMNRRAQYDFHDIMPQSYQVFSLGTLPRPGAGDTITTPTVTNDQFIFVGDPLTHEVVVKQSESGSQQ